MQSAIVWRKSLQPQAVTAASEWASVATKLKGKVKLGAVDATVHSRKASQYGIERYPTIKYFPAGKKSKDTVKEYDGGRTSKDIVNWDLDKVAENVPAPEIKQILSKDTFEEECDQKTLCVISVLPHILDCQIWTEAGSQYELENSLDIGGFGYSILRGAFSKDGINEFLRDLPYGRGNTAPVKGGQLPKKNWLVLKNRCYWPKSTAVTALVKQAVLPKDNWMTLKSKIFTKKNGQIRYYDNYYAAEEKVDVALQTSDLSSQSSLEEELINSSAVTSSPPEVMDFIINLLPPKMFYIAMNGLNATLSPMLQLPPDLTQTTHKTELQQEEYSKIPQKANALVKYLSGIGGLHVGNATRRVWAALVTDQVSNQLSWNGANNKYKLQGLNVNRIVIASVKKIISTATEMDVLVATKYNDTKLPTQKNETDRYHRQCYSSFTALMAKYCDLLSETDYASNSSPPTSANSEIACEVASSNSNNPGQSQSQSLSDPSISGHSHLSSNSGILSEDAASSLDSQTTLDVAASSSTCDLSINENVVTKFLTPILKILIQIDNLISSQDGTKDRGNTFTLDVFFWLAALETRYDL
ncbi:hypothetical protein RN001_003404 [Aquatica leii]|uniref:Thioredoxin domain-containing protein n=1 Tax=Aquatica leii TaxID=1421715 RepID=A0AAN7QP32_9COLE|nr:hypothetical protein RN001_003404 [Aquatica leii]